MKEYLEGKIKLKNPTLGDLLEVIEIIREKPSVAITGQSLFDVINIICEVDKEVDLKLIDPKIAKEILKDFFHIWNPLAWTSEITGIVIQSLKSSQQQLQDSEISKKGLEQE